MKVRYNNILNEENLISPEKANEWDEEIRGI